MMHTRMRRQSLRSIAALSFLCISSFAYAANEADSYPSRPVNIVTGAQAGSGLDILTRMVADGLSKKWGVSVIVQNKPGASNSIAARQVANSPADGYTLFTVPSSIIQTTLLYKDAKVKMEDLAPVSKMVIWPNVLAVRGDLSINSLKDFVAAAKARPGKLTYGTVGVGSSGHLIGATLGSVAQIDIRHVPYKGEMSAISDLLGGRLDAVIGSTGSLAPHAAQGKLHIIAVASPQRLKDYSTFPTFAEQGYEKAGLAGWGGLFAPKNTPKAIVSKISRATAEIVEVSRNREFIQKSLGAIPYGSTPEAFQKSLNNDFSSVQEVIRKAHIEVN